jgi:GntR family transcriptional regulator
MITSEQQIPKYYQISQEIIGLIESGKLTPGAKAPSENEIIEQYKVSNTTARKALQELEKNGVVSRVKGKGTFVLEPHIERSVTRILSFTKNMINEGRKPSTKLVSLHLFEPEFSLSVNNRRYLLQGPLCKIQRLRFGDDIPILFETRYISLKFCPDIHKLDLETSLYEIYEKVYGLQLHEIKQELSATMLDKPCMKQFGLEKPIPAFKVDGVTFCGKELILEMEESIYRGDIYSFNVTAKR